MCRPLSVAELSSYKAGPVCRIFFFFVGAMAETSTFYREVVVVPQGFLFPIYITSG